MNGLWLLVIPIFGAFLLPTIYKQHELAPKWGVSAILGFSILITLNLWADVIKNGAQTMAMGGYPAPLGIVFYIDQFSLLFIMMVLVGTIILRLGKEVAPVKEDMLTLWLVGASCGLAMSGDLFNIYVFYEIIAIASYGLAGSHGRNASYAASLRYLILGTLGSAFALLGIALIYATTGTLNLSHLSVIGPELLNTPVGLMAFTFILIGLGVKAELFPVNTWVPEVYATTSVRTAALLGGIVSKLALLVVVRLLVLIYADTNAPLLLMTLGILGVITGEFSALRATNFRQVLSYSSIGQLGLIAIAFSIPSTAGIIAGIALALHHAVVKSALFMLAEAWQGHLSKLTGAAHGSKTSAVMFLILALSLTGIPPLPGFWAKFLLISAAIQAGNDWYLLAVVAVMIATVIETAYFIRIARIIFQKPYEENKTTAIVPQRQELVPALTLSGLLLITTLTIGWIGDGMKTVADQTADKALYLEQSLPAWQDYKPEDFK